MELEGSAVGLDQAEKPLFRSARARLRKRTKRACDKCSGSRVRCDGQCPCRRCEEYGHACHYNRDVQKRGRKLGWTKPRNPPRPQTPSNRDNRLKDAATSAGLSPISPPWSAQAEEFERSESISTSQSAGQPGQRVVQTAKQPEVQNKFYDTIEGFIQTQSVLRLDYESSNRDFRDQPAETDHPKAACDLQNDLPDFANTNQNCGLFTTSYYYRSNLSSTCKLGNSALDVSNSKRYKCLEPILPLLQGIIDQELAYELLALYFVEPGNSVFRCASPYVLTHVLRKKAVLHPDKPRPTRPALLMTMLWVGAQTAENTVFLLPGKRAKICNQLQDVLMQLIEQEDPDRWYRTQIGWMNNDNINPQTGDILLSHTSPVPVVPSSPSIDHVLTYILLTIVLSGGDFRTDSLVWWNKAVRLAKQLGIHREDGPCHGTDSVCEMIMCDCRKTKTTPNSITSLEQREERRRTFWLLFSLDRHLALSFNSTLQVTDQDCEVFTPLPDNIWESLESTPISLLAQRNYGPPAVVTGTGFFEYFLPLMTILGDIIQVHQQKSHPRFGIHHTQDLVAVVDAELTACSQSISEFANSCHTNTLERYNKPSLVTVYSTFILHVLRVLLYGNWDALTMLDSKEQWCMSANFMKCVAHTITASEAISEILSLDPELTFMPYLFGIYLLHGSFILLLFADGMPQIGLDESVERACEVIIRAHEVCVVTLNTDFQIRFRRVLRSTLNSIRNPGAVSADEREARRVALSLYRWRNGSNGLAL